MTLENFKEYGVPDCDYAALAHAFREKGCALATAASFNIGTWDGQHRLALAIRDWYELVATERTYTT